MTDELVIFVDYVGKSYYGVFIGDIKENPDIVATSVDAAVNWIIDNYGIESHVEFSHSAELIFKIENGIPIDKDLS